MMLKKVYVIAVSAIFIFNFILLYDVVAVQTPGIYLITTSQGWINAGFDPENMPIYENEVFCGSYYMPIALKKEDINNLLPKDVEHTIYNGNQNFSDRLNYIDFEILESETYYVVIYEMNINSGDPFNIDFVPKIKGEELRQFAWWNSSFLNRFDCFVISTAPSLTNFPVGVLITNSSMIAKMNSGNSVRFTNTANNTVYYHEIDFINSTHALFWVNITSFTGGMHFNCYYNNSGVTNTSNANTWDSNYIAVYHLNELSGSVVLDSTLNYLNSTYVGNMPSRIDSSFNGKPGYHQSADGSGDCIQLNTGLWVNSMNTYTIEGWYSLDQDGQYYHLVNFNAVEADSSVGLRFRDDVNKVRADAYDAGGWDFQLLSDTFAYTSIMQHLSLAWQTNDAVLHHDGNLISTDTSVSLSITQNGLSVMANGAKTSFSPGDVDELRFSKTRRSKTWMTACYDNQNNITSYVTYGQETTYETPPPIYYYAPTITNPGITNASENNSIFIGNFNVTINHYNNSAFNWNITINSWNIGNTTDHNGLKILTFPNLDLYTVYYVYVNATLSSNTSVKNESYYTFMTGINLSGYIKESDNIEVDIGIQTMIIIIWLVIVFLLFKVNRNYLYIPLGFGGSQLMILGYIYYQGYLSGIIEYLLVFGFILLVFSIYKTQKGLKQLKQ